MKNLVENQYSQWVYPLPIEDMKESINNGFFEIGDPFLYWPLFWPNARSVKKNLNILVAGCGTNQAAYYASRFKTWNVLGIDLSEPSLIHQNKLKEKHKLINLTLKKFDLTKIESLNLNFDFITSTGVLHHLPNPDEGLKALSNVLKPEGVINLMVYGKSLRLGVYLIQEAFRIMGLQQTKKDVELAKIIIKTLPNDHVVKRYVNMASDLTYDAGIIDTFLHSQDQAYWVKDIYSFTRRAGLEFLTWCDPVEYSLEAHIPAEHPAWEKLQNLSLEDAAHVCDLLAQGRGTHRWAAAHPEYVNKIRIPFNNKKLLDCSLALNPNTKIIIQGNYLNKQNAKCERGNQKFEVTYLLAELIDKMTGRESIAQAISKLKITIENNKLIDDLRKQIESLYIRGHIYVFLPEVKTRA